MIDFSIQIGFYLVMLFIMIFMGYLYTETSESQSQKEKLVKDKRNRLISFAVIASDIMLKDGYATTAELNVAKAYISNNFSEEDGKRILSLMKQYIKNGTGLNSENYARIAAFHYTYKERWDMAHLFFQIANFHGGICNNEWKTLCVVIEGLKLTDEDQEKLILYYRNFATGREKAEGAINDSDFTPNKVSTIENKCLQMLGLQKDASLEEIKDAYRKLVKQYHPDRLPKNLSDAEREKATTIFRNVQKAYEKLTELRTVN